MPVRDRRFVAAHRGGPLDIVKHRLLAIWAAECAEHVLPIFEQCSQDERPRIAIEMARAWARGEITVGAARKASVAAHAAAREIKNPAATAVARAAGHAVATAHMADHSLGPALYAVKAVEAIGASAEAERSWQIDRLPEALREWVILALEQREKNMQPRSLAGQSRKRLPPPAS